MRTIILSYIFLFSVFCSFGQKVLWTSEVNPQGMRTNGVSFTPDGQSIVAGTDCHPAKIRRFDGESGDLTWDYTVSDELMCIMGVGVSASEKYLAAIEEFGNLLLFDYTQKEPILVKTVELGSSYAFKTVFSPDSRNVAVGASDGKLFVVNAETGSIEHEISAHARWVLALAYSADGKYIATGSNDRIVKVWNDLGEIVRVLQGHSGDITALQFSKDGKYVYSSSVDGTVRQWDLESGETTKTYEIASARIHDFCLSPDETQMATVSKDKTLRVWDLETGQSSFPFTFLEDEGKALDWSPNEAKVAVGTETGKLTLFDIADALTAKTPSTFSRSITLYPNPVDASSQWVIDLQGATDVRLQVYQSNGKLVFSRSGMVSGLQVPSFLMPGVYFYTVRNEEELFYTGRLVKE